MIIYDDFDAQNNDDHEDYYDDDHDDNCQNSDLLSCACANDDHDHQ